MLSVKVIQSLTVNSRSLLKFTPILYQQLPKRFQSTKQKGLSKSVKSEIDTNVKPLGEKVKETTKTASYLGIILLGVGVTGTLFYAVFNELFSSKSPNNVYSKAAKRCKDDTRIQDKLGVPITTYGEETRRGRRQHVSHVIYMGKDDRRHLRMKFHLKGAVHTGTAHLDMVENDSGNYDYRFLFVEIDDMLRNTIVLEDNRNVDSVIGKTPSFDELTY